MNVGLLLRGLSLTLLIAFAAMQLLLQLFLLVLFVCLLVGGSWFEMPECWPTLVTCSGYEKLAFFVLIYAASGWIADSIVGVIWLRADAKDHHPKRRLGVSVTLAVLIAAGAYAYLAFGGEGAAAILNLATSDGIVTLGIVVLVAAIALQYFFFALGMLGVLGEGIVFVARHLRRRLQVRNS